MSIASESIKIRFGCLIHVLQILLSLTFPDEAWNIIFADESSKPMTGKKKEQKEKKKEKRRKQNIKGKQTNKRYNSISNNNNNKTFLWPG